MVIGQLFMLHAFVGTWIGGRAYISYAVLVLHCTRIFSQLLYLQESDEDDGPMPVRQLDELQGEGERGVNYGGALLPGDCLLYTSPSPRDGLLSRMPSSA